MAFVTRSHQHLWGKNNEDPLVFLFQQDLANLFVKNMHMGWNKNGQERPLKNWGLGYTASQILHKPGNFFLPPGIVFPYIVEKKVKAVFIHPLDSSDQSFRVPGSSKEPILLGNPKNSIEEVDGLFKGLRLFQEKQQSIFVKIRPKLLPD